MTTPLLLPATAVWGNALREITDNDDLTLAGSSQQCYYYLNGNGGKGADNANAAFRNALKDGAVVELYVNDEDRDEVTSVVVLEYSLAKVKEISTRVTSSDREDGITSYITLETVGGASFGSRIDNVDFAGFNYDEGDVILVAMKGSNVVLASELADSVSGEITATRGDEVRINGTYYKDTTSASIGDEGTFYLNKAGQIMGSEADSTQSDNYAYIYAIDKDTGLSADGLSNDPIYIAYAVLADGTKVSYEIDAVKGTNDNTGKYYFDDAQTIEIKNGNSWTGGLIAYSINGDDELVYEAPSDNIVGKLNGKIDKDNVLLGKGTVDGTPNTSVRATSSTQFIFANVDGNKMDVSLATGYKNVSIASSDNMYVVADDDGYALYVFVDAENGSLSSDEAVFVLLDNKAVVTREDGTNYYTYTVAVDGEETELTWKGTNELSSANKGDVYTYKMDGDYVEASSISKQSVVKVVATNNDYVIFDTAKGGNNRFDWDTATVYTITIEYKSDGVTIDTVSVTEGGAVEANDQVYYTVDGSDLDLVFVIDEIK